MAKRYSMLELLIANAAMADMPRRRKAVRTETRHDTRPAPHRPARRLGHRSDG